MGASSLQAGAGTVGAMAIAAAISRPLPMPTTSRTAHNSLAILSVLKERARPSSSVGDKDVEPAERLHASSTRPDRCSRHLMSARA